MKAGRPTAPIVSFTTAIVGAYLIVPSDMKFLHLVAIVGSIGGSLIGEILVKDDHNQVLRLGVVTGLMAAFVTSILSYVLFIEFAATGGLVVVALGLLMLCIFATLACLTQMGGVAYDKWILA